MRRGVGDRAWRLSAIAVAALALLVAFLARPAQHDEATIPVQLIDLNTAPPEMLQLLDGVGPTLARRIVADRTEFGPFRTLEDADRVPRIGPRTLRAIAPDVTQSHAAP